MSAVNPACYTMQFTDLKKKNVLHHASHIFAIREAHEARKQLSRGSVAHSGHSTEHPDLRCPYQVPRHLLERCGSVSSQRYQELQ